MLPPDSRDSSEFSTMYFLEMTLRDWNARFDPIAVTNPYLPHAPQPQPPPPPPRAPLSAALRGAGAAVVHLSAFADFAAETY